MNAETFNSRYPVGTPVFAYPGARPEDFPNDRRLVTRTRSKASVLGGHTDVVWVDGHSACIALSHVDVVSETVYEAAKKAERTAAAVAAARPKPASDDPRDVEIARLQRKVAGLKAEQDRDDAEYAEVIAERDRALKTIAELEAERLTQNQALDDAVRELRTPYAERARRERHPGRRQAWLMLASAQEAERVADVLLNPKAARSASKGPQPSVEGEHYAAVHHDYRQSRDLPHTQTAEEASA
ncbi:hypothetical protein ACFW2I_09165 [Streptomyces nigra]|uniref:hypothetical protein n=1 Tax=Streptomyces nigra TaxID=1827580 RepID=UPI0036BE04A0